MTYRPCVSSDKAKHISHVQPPVSHHYRQCFSVGSTCSELLLPSSMPRLERKARVDKVIDVLRLEKSRSTTIGGSLKRGISGGEAKRVNIGIALISNPNVIFLDEPTTGLDSNMANEIAVLLQSLARGGSTVVAILHNPTALTFSMFDNLMMLSKRGHVIYNGPRADARIYYESLGPRYYRHSFLVVIEGKLRITCSLF